MTTPAPPVNPCSLCGKQEAILSLMSLDDWSQVKACAGCAPVFLRQIAGDIEGAVAELPQETAASQPATVPQGRDVEEDEMTDDTPEPAPEPAPARRSRSHQPKEA